MGLKKTPLKIVLNTLRSDALHVMTLTAVLDGFNVTLGQQLVEQRCNPTISKVTFMFAVTQ